jgi:hypothetical protein
MPDSGLLVVAARSAPDREVCWLPRLCPEDRQTERATVLPMPLTKRSGVAPPDENSTRSPQRSTGRSLDEETPCLQSQIGRGRHLA